MPTILIQDGFRLFFYSEERNEPIHIHVAYGGAIAKFWISPRIILASNIGLKTQEIKKAKYIISVNLNLITEKWNEFDKKRKS